MNLSRTALLCFALLFPLSSTVHAQQLNDLQAHLDTFIALNYAGQISYSAIEIETVSVGSDVDALATLVADNFWILDPATGTFVQLTGPEQSTFITQSVLPKLVDGALVAEVVWWLNGQTVVTYAIVSPGPNPVGDTEANFEGVTGFYTVDDNVSALLSAPQAFSTYHKGFKNGFGTHVADFDASLNCIGGDTCSGNATCNEARPGCSCKAEKKVKCLANGNCQMDVAFAGFCGFPSVELEAKKFKFKVSGWGWAYFNASITLDKVCNWKPQAVPVVAIDSPATGTTLAYRSPVTFVGTAVDDQDGDLSEAIFWSSDRDGILGVGQSYTTDELSRGFHQVTAEVTDSEGLSGFAFVELSVEDCEGCGDPTEVPNQLPREALCLAKADFNHGTEGWTDTSSSRCTAGTFALETSGLGLVAQTVSHATDPGRDLQNDAVLSARPSRAGSLDGSGLCILESPTYAVARPSEVSIWTFQNGPIARKAGDDAFQLEISMDGGTTWTDLARESGDLAWNRAVASIPAGSNVKLRLQVPERTAASPGVVVGLDNFSLCTTN